MRDEKESQQPQPPTINEITIPDLDWSSWSLPAPSPGTKVTRGHFALQPWPRRKTLPRLPSSSRAVLLPAYY